MSKDTRLARVAHVLVHMSFNEGKATSETIAAMLDTNPVVVRRIMGALREGGYVSSERGPNGGWRLERPLREITFLNIYKAFDPGSPFTIATSDDHPKCVVERAANRALSDALSDAADRFEQSLSKITLDQLLPRKI
ncbi:Rrf2 family transcriptional regulator [Bradyrhizobium icense]|nr:Rrf2 family transcriptional regulator [Bradyrhizobium icense]